MKNSLTIKIIKYSCVNKCEYAVSVGNVCIAIVKADSMEEAMTIVLDRMKSDLNTA